MKVENLHIGNKNGKTYLQLYGGGKIYENEILRSCEGTEDHLYICGNCCTVPSMFKFIMNSGYFDYPFDYRLTIAIEFEKMKGQSIVEHLHSEAKSKFDLFYNKMVLANYHKVIFSVADNVTINLKNFAEALNRFSTIGKIKL